ncbi:MBL fold metallo-hydrolase [bacterium]|nr:MBL fold metallo-hydrolase [bacterium]
MQYRVLASGSQGNSLLIYTDQTKILVDCGISFKKIIEKLGALDFSIQDINAVLITHGHSDHIRSLSSISKHIPVFMTGALFEHINSKGKIKLNETNIGLILNKDNFDINELNISVVPVEHDCIDPVGFVIQSSEESIGVFTDLGKATDDVRNAMNRCSILFIESNHDTQMLINCERPWFLKNRILKNDGHLSNRRAGQLVSSVNGQNLKQVILMHLSEDCNCPKLAVATVLEELQDAVTLPIVKACTPDGDLI